ncbi:sterol desaturase family protein [Rhodobacteraceae bacterium NNCM2]|nr:sterol desaturase family protein [Coraliihabitans acroporae]
MENEAVLRLGVFFGVFAALAIWEIFAPRRVLTLGRSGRWLTNWGLSVLNTGVTAAMKIVLGAAAVLAALDVQALGLGLFNQLDWPLWVEVVVVFLILDFVIWAQHWLSHQVPLLWRLHRVHHADRDIDVTTAIRFHPIEIALSMGLKIVVVYLLGAPVIAVILFEVILNGAAMFNHANIRLGKWDRLVRMVIVTPDMHRVHHSIHRDEHDTNYGFNLSIWDRLFGTYRPQPRGGHDGMTIGLQDHQDTAPARLFWALGFPFRKS